MQKAKISFVLGLAVGLVLALLTASYFTGPAGLSISRQRLFRTSLDLSSGTPGRSVQSRDDLDKIKQIMRPVQFEDVHAHHDDNTTAEALRKKVRVLCWIMTCPQNLEKKAIHIKKTWAYRCNKYIFISSQTDPSFPTVGINTTEGRDHLTAKTMQAFRYIYDHHMDDADWFMKADDDTFVIVENLRYFLSNEDPNDPVYFGHHFATIVKQGYFSGGAGYIISKEAMRRFGVKANDSKLCRQDGGSEDVEFGRCMENLSVKLGNSTDSLGRSRFHCFKPETHLIGSYPPWYYKYDAHGAQKGQETISDYAISFHYVSPATLYDLAFYTYHLRPYGIHSGYQDINQHHNDNGSKGPRVTHDIARI